MEKFEFQWTPIKTYCNKPLPVELIEKVLKHTSHYYTRWDDVRKRRSTYPIKKEVRWDFYDYEANSFPSGFLGQVVADFEPESYEIVSIWEKPLKKYLHLQERFEDFLAREGKTERYFQSEAVDVIEEYGCGVIEVGTAGGKTILYGSLVARLGVKTLIITIDLLSKNNTAQEFIKFFGVDNVSLIESEKYNLPITVANVQNLWAKFKAKDPEFLSFLNTIDLLIVNEAHHINESKLIHLADLGNTWYTLCQNIPAYYRVGGTGTVGKEGSLERALITAAIGDVIYYKPTRELIDEGFATDIEIHAYKIDSPNDEHIEYVKAYMNMIEHKPFNEFIAKIAKHYAIDKKVLIFCDWVEKQAIKLQELIGEDKCGLVHGGTKVKQRNEIIGAFRDGEFPILIGTVFNEDFNLPALDVGIIIGKKKNEKALKQRVGRLTRLFEGKEKGILVVPFVQDWRVKNGDTIPGILARHSKEALAILAKEGYKVEFKDFANVGGQKEIMPKTKLHLK